MMFTSIEFDSNGEDFQSCYRYEISRFTISDFLRGSASYLRCFSIRTLDKIYNSLLDGKELFALYGIMIEACSESYDRYDRPMILAISNSIDELGILADLHNLAPVVNKV